MAKKPKKQWQIHARSKLEQRGIGYAELAAEIGSNEGTVRQVMCKDNCPGIREKICSYLDVELIETVTGGEETCLKQTS